MQDLPLERLSVVGLRMQGVRCRGVAFVTDVCVDGELQIDPALEVIEPQASRVRTSYFAKTVAGA